LWELHIVQPTNAAAAAHNKVLNDSEAKMRQVFTEITLLLKGEVYLLEKGPSGATEAVLLHELWVRFTNIWNLSYCIVGEGNQAPLNIDESDVQSWLQAEKGRWLCGHYTIGWYGGCRFRGKFRGRRRLKWW
jgi:hypothetical protein